MMINKSEEQKEKRLRKRTEPKKPVGAIKRISIYIVEVPEREGWGRRRRRGRGKGEEQR
jgi:hypothetical protein